MNVTKWFCLRTAAALCLCTIFLMAQSGGITTKDQGAKEAVDAALKVLGGADKIDGIKSLIIKGTQTFENTESPTSVQLGLSPEPGSTIDFEVRILLPDSFLQIDRFSGRTRYRGISKGKLLTPVIITDSREGTAKLVDNANPAFARTVEMMQKVLLETAVAEWSHFLIGILLKSDFLPMTLSSGSTPGVFSITGDATGEIEFDPKTWYPSVVRYKAAGIGTGSRVMQFNDRFSVEGIMFPRIITTADTGKTERRIEEVQINPKLNLKDFEIQK